MNEPNLLVAQDSASSCSQSHPRAANHSNPWQPAKLPFHRSDSIVPKTIPSASEIRKATGIVKIRTGQTIVAIGPNIIVKYGTTTPIREGQTLLYLESCLPDVPAPRLYSMYYDADDLFLIMERVPGVSLDSIWDDLTELEKSSLTAKLQTIFNELRSAQCSEPEFFGSVDYGPVGDHLFFSHEGRKEITGPFANEQAFHNALVLQYRTIQDMNGFPHYKTTFYEKHIHQVLRNSKPTLTHSDVQRKNIVIDLKGDKSEQDPRSFDIALVDWEDAGWYPEYWEYFSIFAGLRWNDDWCTRVEDFIPVDPAETALMKMLYQDLFF